MVSNVFAREFSFAAFYIRIQSVCSVLFFDTGWRDNSAVARHGIVNLYKRAGVFLVEKNHCSVEYFRPERRCLVRKADVSFFFGQPFAAVCRIRKLGTAERRRVHTCQKIRKRACFAPLLLFPSLEAIYVCVRSASSSLLYALGPSRQNSLSSCVVGD